MTPAAERARSTMFARFNRWHAVIAGLVLGVGLGIFTLTCTSQQPGDGAKAPGDKDKQDSKKKPGGEYKEIVFLDLGIVLLTPEEDRSKTGFMVAGKNTSGLIRGLKKINGRTIAALEKDMRPGALSMAGFLGKDEKLLDVLVGDNEYVVDLMGMSHQELARPLYAMEAIFHKLEGKPNTKEPVRCSYHGRRYEIRLEATRGDQESPFGDGTKTNVYLHVNNVDNGQKLEYSGLLPRMIERYGFYEGKGTSYRVEPKQLIEVFDFLKPGPK
jgi:hypothetical protein